MAFLLGQGMSKSERAVAAAAPAPALSSACTACASPSSTSPKAQGAPRLPLSFCFLGLKREGGWREAAGQRLRSVAAKSQSLFRSVL